MDFSKFVQYASDIEAESSNTTKINLVAQMLSEADDDIGVSARFIQGKLFPEWDETKIKVGPATMYEALAEATTSDRGEVEDAVAEYGGVGEACEQLEFTGSQSGQQQLPALGETVSVTLSEVYETLLDLSDVSGSGSQETKIKTLSNVLLDCETSHEAKYFTRLILGEMRIGVGEGTVRDGIAQAFSIEEGLVKRALMVKNDVGEVARIARVDGESGLQNLTMSLGRPIQAMLAQAGDIETVITEGSTAETDEVIVEYKYDGSRLQIHKEEDDVQLFTRNFENVTESLPDIVDSVRSNVTAERVILDAEVVAYKVADDGSYGDPLPFQEVMRRVGRKHNVEEMADEISVEVRVFDILYQDGEELIDEPLFERREILENVCSEFVTPYWTVTETDRVRELETESLHAGNEGLMVKNPQATYTPGSRGKNWLKIKPETETLDCVVVGGEWGEGRRANVVGTYLLAVRGTDGGLKPIGKVATGMTDEQLEELTDKFEPLIESEDGKEITFTPAVTFEVGYEEIQPSPTYDSGYALRFPRFLGVRSDKDVSDADSVERVERLV